MGQQFMPMQMVMFAAWWKHGIVFMPAVFVVNMFMVVFKHLMDMFMLVFFCQMQPHPNRHEHARRQQLRCDRLVQQRDGQSRTKKRCY